MRSQAHHIGLPELKLSDFLLFVARFRFPTKRPFYFYHHRVQASSGHAVFSEYRRLYHRLCSGQNVNLTAAFHLMPRSKIPDVQFHLHSSHYSHFPRKYTAYTSVELLVLLFCIVEVQGSNLILKFDYSGSGLSLFSGVQPECAKFCFTCFPSY